MPTKEQGRPLRRHLVTLTCAAIAVGAAAALETNAPPTARSPAELPPLAVRVSRPVWDLPNLQHERVDYWVHRYTTNPELRERFEQFMARMGRYESLISAELAERGMPQDLIYLAMLESGFQPRAYSSAHASGLWQFIPATARRFGLTINRAVDERNDPVRATAAALEYLEHLHGRFGSWYLAAAAYNTGENRVGRLMREVTGAERATSEADYYRIWHRLPAETREYVPLMIAFARMAKHADYYGFSAIEKERPLDYEEIVAPPATPLRQIATRAGSSIERLRALNPHLNLNRTPNNRPYPVRVPVDAAVVR